MQEDKALNCLPTEILIKILVLLPVKQLMTCRKVCRRWKVIIDGLKHRESLWQEYFKRDFSGKYTHLYTPPGLQWFSIYRSISVWPKLPDASETRDEFASASVMNEEIKNFLILRNGTLGVHKHNAIVYYNLFNWKRSKLPQIENNYLKYSESDYILVTLNLRLQLEIVQKGIEKNGAANQLAIRFENVKTFLMTESEVYYVNLNDDIFVCKLEGASDFRNYFLKRCEDGVMSLGYIDGCLNVLSFQRNIYSLINKDFLFAYAIDASTNLLHILREYNFLEHLDWRIYFQWMYVLNHNIPEGPLRDIVTVRTYGDVVFVGSNWGVLRIYYAPYKSGEFDFLNAEPIKQYNFMEPKDCPVLSVCPIIKVDVLETENGHTVLVAMPKKITILNFNHQFL